MGGMFSKPKAPEPPKAAPPPPTMTDASTDIAAQQMQESLQRGRASTILTSGQGLLGSAGETTKKQLLGG